jgi:hypothetical protein
MNLKQLSHDIYHAARGDKCRIEDIQNMLEKALNVAETKGCTDAEYDQGHALDSLEDKPEPTSDAEISTDEKYNELARSTPRECRSPFSDRSGRTPVPSDAEAWQHANDTVVMADMVRIGKENEALRLEVGALRDINSAAHDQLAEAYEEQERLRQRMKGCS